MNEVEILVYLLQAVSSGLILLCLWVGKQVWAGVRNLENEQSDHRLEVEKKIAVLRLDTMTKIAAIENELKNKRDK
jgi:hypothetical protein